MRYNCISIRLVELLTDIIYVHCYRGNRNLSYYFYILKLLIKLYGEMRVLNNKKYSN